MISDFFIARPVLANVLAILMMVIGGVAMFALPVAQYPDLVPPTVQVTTRYPGASARTVVDTVALPIEQQVNGVEGMSYMQSYSGADGSYSLTVTFKVGVDLNIAQVLVQNRVSSALSSLPQAVQAQGVVVQKNSTAILQIVTLTSPDSRYDSLYLANYATIKLKDEIAINFSTLFAIVLAIGIVVDDAIVVVEGAVHNIERGMPGREAASAAMRQLFGPIVGITLVLMSVFLPAAFLPGLTGRMYAQFALVIAATALLSAINAATLKPTQCALWLRPAVPPQQRNVVYRAFHRGYGRVERWYGSLIARMVWRSGLMAAAAIALIAATGYWFSRVPTGFLPIEDQGYMIALVQLPDGASLERTQKALDKVFEIARQTPGVARVVNIAGVSTLDNSATLSSAGVSYIILKDWSERGEGEDLMSLFNNLNAALGAIPEADILVMPPPPIQGVGNDAGFTMQAELRDGSFDMAKLQSVTNAIVANAKTQSALQMVLASFRSSVPQYRLEVDRVKTEALQVSLDQVFAALAGYLGSTYVNQFNQFGRVFQVYVQADSQSRVRLEDIENMFVRNRDGQMVPLGTLVKITPTVGPSLISLYNLRPSATIIGLPAQGVSSGQALTLME